MTPRSSLTPCPAGLVAVWCRDIFVIIGRTRLAQHNRLSARTQEHCNAPQVTTQDFYAPAQQDTARAAAHMTAICGRVRALLPRLPRLDVWSCQVVRCCTPQRVPPILVRVCRVEEVVFPLSIANVWRLNNIAFPRLHAFAHVDSGLAKFRTLRRQLNPAQSSHVVISMAFNGVGSLSEQLSNFGSLRQQRDSPGHCG